MTETRDETLTPLADAPAPGSNRAADLLEDLLLRAGQPGADGLVEFVGADPVLPTPFPMAEFGAAAIGAAALQAARLHRERTGLEQTVRVPLDASAAAMRAWRYLHDVPRRPEAGGAPPVAFYRTGDGRWLFLHRLAAHHLERALAVLGTGEDEDEIVRAIGRRDAAELEEAIMAAGGCAAAVRDREEWAAHPQAAAIAGMPLFRITKIGESEPVPVGDGLRPLGGLRVLDLTRVLAGPTAARTLAEQGADVLRIGSPRYPDTFRMVQDTGHGKRSTVLDLRDGGDLEALRGLLAGADVFSQGYRPGAIASFGLAPAELAELRPGIVSLSISAFGAAGPWAGRRGFDSVVQAASGVAAEMGEFLGGESPRSLPGNPLDYTSGYLAAFLVQVALERRAREGGSYHIELSLAQTGRYLDELPRVDGFAAAKRPPELPAERLDELMTTRETPYGALRHLQPVAELSGTPAHWERPTAPLDHDGPTWG
ncbi:MAG: CoA transferase [Microbacteriaceae bacterium]|nr:CoA transferase [Microbacteriaceae bacterium]